jgi:tetratricopeptide (TPR) repeat protein
MILLLGGVWLWNLGGCGGGSSLLNGGGANLNATGAAQDQVRSGVAALRRGDTRGANGDFLDAVHDLGGDAGAYVFVARDLLRRDLAQPAVSLLTAATKDKDLSWDPNLWAALADAYRKADDATQARGVDAAADRAAQTLFSTLGTKPMSSADQKTQSGRLSELGLFYSEERNDMPHAFQALRAAYDLTPDDAATLNNLGYKLVERGTTPDELKEGLKYTQRAATIAPEEGDVLDSYGWALFKSGDLTGAERVLNEASAAMPDSGVIHFHLGTVYAKENQIAGAALELDQAIALDPDLKEAAEARRALPPIPPSPSPKPTPDSLFAPPSPTPSAAPTPLTTVSPAPGRMVGPPPPQTGDGVPGVHG